MNNVKVKALLLTVLVAASPLSAGWSSDWTHTAKNGLSKAAVPFQWAWSKRGDVFSSCVLSYMGTGLNHAGSFIYNNPKKVGLGLLAPVAIVAIKVLCDKIKSSKDSEKQASTETQKQDQTQKVRVGKPSLLYPNCTSCSDSCFCEKHSGRPFSNNGRSQQKRTGCSNGRCHR